MPTPHISCTALTFTSVLSVAAAMMPARADAIATNEGTAYRLDDGAAAYREIHLLYASGGVPARLVLYRCMNGAPFARKTMIEPAGEMTPDFNFFDGRTGYREGVRSTVRGREIYWQKSATAVENVKKLVIPANAVIDAGFDSMIRTHWASLGMGTSISANFLLPSALRFLKLSIEQVKGDPVPGVIHLRMKLDIWYGFVAPDTDLYYRSSDQRLLRFKGIGTIRDTRGRNQAVRIEFPDGLQGRQASASEIAAARRLPLTGRCGA